MAYDEVNKLVYKHLQAFCTSYAMTIEVPERPSQLQIQNYQKQQQRLKKIAKTTVAVKAAAAITAKPKSRQSLSYHRSRGEAAALSANKNNRSGGTDGRLSLSSR